MADQKILLELEHVGKKYESPDGVESAPILKDISLNVMEGESLAIVGPSGSGKSTLLNIIGALDRPSTGKVTLDARDLSTLSDNDLAALRNREVGFVFQLHFLLPQCTVMENVLIPTLPGATRASSDEAARRANLLLDRVGLGARKHYRPGQLSGGECQRAAVVRALINQPRLLLADEPTGSLDAVATEKLIQLLVELNKENKVTLIVVTHSMKLAGRMGRVFNLSDGRLAPSSPKATQGRP